MKRIPIIEFARSVVYGCMLQGYIYIYIYIMKEKCV